MITVVPVGENPTRLWGLSTTERIRRMALASGYRIADRIEGEGPALLANATYVFDPTWLRHFAARPGEALTFRCVPVVAHCRDAHEIRLVERAMREGRPLAGSPLAESPHEERARAVNSELRKRETPFAMELQPSSVRAAERASYFGAYKGVTDILTKYLWPEWALVLTRIAAKLGFSPNAVTAIGAIFCVLAFAAFWHGHYWAGMAAGLVFMVLDTVDGKLARCTITSSKWGNLFDHGIDLVHPPFWWYAWGAGLSAYGRPLGDATLDLTLVVIIAGYVIQRLVEGAFMRLYGMHIHIWKKIDSDFRLITARRNPNMVILFAAMLFARPDIGFVAVAVWTLLSLTFHAARLATAMRISRRGGRITSWLEAA